MDLAVGPMQQSMEDIFAELSLDKIVHDLSDDSANEFPVSEPVGAVDVANIFTPTPTGTGKTPGRTPGSSSTAGGRRSRGHRRASSDPEALRRFAASAPQAGIVLAPPPPPVSPLSQRRSQRAAAKKAAAAAGSPTGEMLDSFVDELDECMGSLGSPDTAMTPGGFGGLGVDLFPATSSSSDDSSSTDSAGGGAGGDDARKKRKRNRRGAGSLTSPRGPDQKTSKGKGGKPKTSRGRYKCGRCGQVKHGHKCITAPETKSMSTQVDLAVTRGGVSAPPQFRVVTVSRRTSISQPPTWEAPAPAPAPFSFNFTAPAPSAPAFPFSAAAASPMLDELRRTVPMAL